MLFGMEASTRIYVRGLPPNLTVEEFRRHFSHPAPITDAKFIQHRRIGYVGYNTPQDAARAIKFHNKSFIRMSKVAVEFARPIDRQNSFGQHKHAANGNYGGLSAGANSEANQDKTFNRQERQDATGRDGNETQRSGAGPKLEEFLQVMQPTSQSNVWEEQRATGLHECQVSRPENLARKLAEEKENLEYEDLPNKRRKLSINMQPPVPVEQEKVLEETGKFEVQEVAQQVLPAPNDEDWLRSRTNRTLDLVEADEAPQRDDKRGLEPSVTTRSKDINTISRSPTPVNGQFATSDPSRNDQTAHESDTQIEHASNRLFLRNLPYSTTENDIRCHIENQGLNGLGEVHLSQNLTTGSNRGFAHLEFSDPDMASKAMAQLDQKSFQGRLLHVLPSYPKRESELDEFALSKLPLKKQKSIRRKAEAPKSTFDWNSMYMSADAVVSSVSKRLGLSKSELLDPTSTDAAIRQAHAETHVIQEAKAYFAANGVDIDAFKGRERGNTCILVKNFSFETKASDLKALFGVYGPLKRFLMPDAGTIAIVEFGEQEHAQSAFRGLAYRKVDGSVLFLEKAPKDLFCGKTDAAQPALSTKSHSNTMSTSDLLDADGQQPADTQSSTLYIRNLNFSTNDERLREAFESLNGYLSAHVKTKADPKHPGQLLSMGYGFADFRTAEQAQAAMAAMQGYRLDGHDLVVRPSRRAADAAEERKKADEARKAAGRKTKIIIKNLPFEATKKDVRSLFGAYGQLRSVRTPRKLDGSTRGFAFADFVTTREAESAVGALRDTHFLGRRLVLDFAAEDGVDPEVEIAKMQQKVGRQTDKVALQKLTGTGRKRFNVEGANEELGQR